MNICAICHEPGKNVIDDITLCADCNLTMQSGSRDSLMQTLGLLARLAKVNSAETSETLAAFAHEAWAGWKRQMATEYADLPEAEKTSDREQATIILSIVVPATLQKIPF